MNRNNNFNNNPMNMNNNYNNNHMDNNYNNNPINSNYNNGTMNNNFNNNPMNNNYNNGTMNNNFNNNHMDNNFNNGPVDNNFNNNHMDNNYNNGPVDNNFNNNHMDNNFNNGTMNNNFNNNHMDNNFNNGTMNNNFNNNHMDNNFNNGNMNNNYYYAQQNNNGNSYGNANFDTQGSLRTANILSFFLGLLGMVIAYQINKDKENIDREFDENYLNLMNTHLGLILVSTVIGLVGSFIPFLSIVAFPLGIYRLVKTVKFHIGVGRGERIEKNFFTFNILKQGETKKNFTKLCGIIGLIFVLTIVLVFGILALAATLVGPSYYY